MAVFAQPVSFCRHQLCRHFAIILTIEVLTVALVRCQELD